MTAIGPFKVTDFGTDRKPVCDFLLVNNTTYVLSRTVSDYHDILVKLLLLTGGVCIYLRHSEKPLNLGP